MSEKVVIIGAGSAMFTRGLVADLIRQKAGIDVAVVSIDSRAQAAADQTDHPLSWQLFDTFGAFPAVLDQHVTEFFPQLLAVHAPDLPQFQH